MVLSTSSSRLRSSTGFAAVLDRPASPAQYARDFLFCRLCRRTDAQAPRRRWRRSPPSSRYPGWSANATQSPRREGPEVTPTGARTTGARSKVEAPAGARAASIPSSAFSGHSRTSSSSSSPSRVDVFIADVAASSVADVFIANTSSHFSSSASRFLRRLARVAFERRRRVVFGAAATRPCRRREPLREERGEPKHLLLSSLTNAHVDGRREKHRAERRPENLDVAIEKKRKRPSRASTSASSASLARARRASAVA